VSRRRVLFVCSELLVGGAERQWSILIPRLRPRFDVYVLTLVAEGPLFAELTKKGVPATCAHLRRRTDPGGWRRALRQAELEPDLVVTQSINADVVGSVIARRAGAPHVTTEHAGPGVRTRAHQELLRRLVARRAAATIAVSDRQLPRLLRSGYCRDRIRVIPNGVPVPEPEPSRDGVREALGVPPDAFVAALVATLRPEKRADSFVSAVTRAHQADPRVIGIVAGGGSELPRVRELAGVDGTVRVLGHRDDVTDVLAASDVVCLSSDAEGVPMVLLEAMALGKPVVATDVGGVSEAVESGSSGLLVAPNDPIAFAGALLELAADPDLARRLGERGRNRHRERFGVERMVDEYARVFDEVLALRR
jgi:glycosyltransferase involved in cell wall biosynthesis